MRTGVDDRLPLKAMILYGLQWWVVSLPSVVIIGLVAARMHFPEIGPQTAYVQKVFGVVGLTTAVQVLWGHRLPLVVGPAAILLVGITASSSADMASVYTAILTGGGVVALVAVSGWLSCLRSLFTPRIVAVILILIAFTLAPSILGMMVADGDRPTLGPVFALGMTFGLVLLNTLLPGIWKSMTVCAGLAVGSVGYFLLAGFPSVALETRAAFGPLLSPLSFDPGTILAFLFCFLALTVNELGSTEAVGQMLGADGMEGRIRRGTAFQGLANVVAGGLGVIGPVDYSLSAGVIAGTGCASRYPLVPAGLGLAACALWPDLVRILCLVPGPVMGALLLFLMSSQLSSGLMMLVGGRAVGDFTAGLTVALPLMVGLVVAFAPAAVFDGLPELVRPIAANGFVMGTLTVLLLEHVVFRNG